MLAEVGVVKGDETFPFEEKEGGFVLVDEAEYAVLEGEDRLELFVEDKSLERRCKASSLA